MPKCKHSCHACGKPCVSELGCYRHKPKEKVKPKLSKVMKKERPEKIVTKDNIDNEFDDDELEEQINRLEIATESDDDTQGNPKKEEESEPEVLLSESSDDDDIAFTDSDSDVVESEAEPDDE